MTHPKKILAAVLAATGATVLFPALANGESLPGLDSDPPPGVDPVLWKLTMLAINLFLLYGGPWLLAKLTAILRALTESTKKGGKK